MVIVSAVVPVVALAGIGDETRPPEIVFVLRVRPAATTAGILASTVADHAVAAFVGVEATEVCDGTARRRLAPPRVTPGFLAMAAWTFVPDRPDADEAREPEGRTTPS